MLFTSGEILYNIYTVYSYEKKYNNVLKYKDYGRTRTLENFLPYI